METMGRPRHQLGQLGQLGMTYDSASAMHTFSFVPLAIVFWITNNDFL
jgi:hypothetical protein